MKMIQIEAARVINAAPEAVYNVLSDYHVGHRAILPQPYFEEMRIEQGGKGAGTEIRLRMRIYGQVYHYHQMVTEPEPGRLLVETDVDTGQFSRFTIDPVGTQQCYVTIYAEFPSKPGLEGLMMRIFQPMITRSIFNKELQNLEAYMRQGVTLSATA